MIMIMIMNQQATSTKLTKKVSSDLHERENIKKTILHVYDNLSNEYCTEFNMLFPMTKCLIVCDKYECNGHYYMIK